MNNDINTNTKIEKEKLDNLVVAYRKIKDNPYDTYITSEFIKMCHDFSDIIDYIEKVDFGGDIKCSVFCRKYNINIVFIIKDGSYIINVYENLLEKKYVFDIYKNFFCAISNQSPSSKRTFIQFIKDWGNKRDYIMKCFYQSFSEYIQELIEYTK